MKRTVIFVGMMILLAGLAYADTIDVLIKGVDDGVKTNKQQDHKEAVMNAKLQAIERAGVEIASITKVVNFQMKYKAVESKAKAVLLPGFQVIDMGYQTDGSYQVVLSGKVRIGKAKSKTDSKSLMNMGKREMVIGDRYHKSAQYKKADKSYYRAVNHFKELLRTFPDSDEALEIERKNIIDLLESKIGVIDFDGIFQLYAKGVVRDTKTGLEWMAGPDKDTTWDEAKQWVESLRVAGGGWRMPTIDELETLYEKGKGSRNMTPLLKTTCSLVWSGDIRDSSSSRFFRFTDGARFWYPRDYSYVRAFAVRSLR